MTQEQKAKAHDESLERAKEYLNSPRTCFDIEQLYNIFPELKESEDERIRGAIMHFISHTPTVPKGIINKEQMLAWLEKQGKRDARYENLEELLEADTIYQMAMNDAMVNEAKEKAVKALSELGIGKLLGFEKKGEQNHSEQDLEMVVEPKFKVGDWVILTAGELSDTIQIADFDTNRKQYWFNDGSYLGIVDEECLHHWTIQDAKDGDVLVSQYNQPFIYNGNYNDYKVGAYCGIEYTGEQFIDTYAEICWADNKFIKPATKEQRELLFQKMKESGYEWDAEKKELKLLITNGGDFESETCKQNPAWGEEDELQMQGIIDLLPGLTIRHNWLKSLKDRVQPKQEWDEDDERSIRDCIFYLKSAKKYFDTDESILFDEQWFNLCIDWLKSLYHKVKLQNTWKPGLE